MDRPEVVVDSNVPITANFRAEQAGPECEAACIRALREIQSGRRTLLDDQGLIVEEYRKSLSHSGQPGLGDAFFKWLWENQGNLRHCRTVPISFHAGRGFAEFPADPQLSAFDRSDRKFVAVARASGTRPELLNATDTDWWQDRKTLEENGVRLVFLCPELMEKGG